MKTHNWHELDRVDDEVLGISAVQADTDAVQGRGEFGHRGARHSVPDRVELTHDDSFNVRAQPM